MLDPGEHLSALGADSEAFADLLDDRAAEGRLGDAVGPCPGWTVADLAGHLGGVYSWTWLVVQAGGERPDREREPVPPEAAQVPTWFREQRRAVLDALSSKEPEEPAWVFLRAGRPEVGWWRRRQALETAVHLWDLQHAGGHAAPIAPELAADGIDEMLTQFAPGVLRRQPVAALEGTLHLHCTDTEGEWSLDFAAADLAVQRRHTKADTAVHGPASDLYLWLWNRVSLEQAPVEVFGRREVAEAWSEVRV